MAQIIQDGVVIFRISSYKMVAYGLGAISDDSEDIDVADPKMESKKICVRSRRPNKRKRRQCQKEQFCEADTEAAAAAVAAAAAAAAERQNELEKVKGYQAKLEERVSNLEATILLATSKQMEIEEETVLLRQRSTLQREELHLARTGEGLEECGVRVNAREHIQPRVTTANCRISNQMPYSAENNQAKEKEDILEILKKSQDDNIARESELEDFLLGFKPGEKEEYVLEIADEEVTKLLEEEDQLQ